MLQWVLHWLPMVQSSLSGVLLALQQKERLNSMSIHLLPQENNINIIIMGYGRKWALWDTSNLGLFVPLLCLSRVGLGLVWMKMVPNECKNQSPWRHLLVGTSSARKVFSRVGRVRYQCPVGDDGTPRSWQSTNGTTYDQRFHGKPCTSTIGYVIGMHYFFL